MVKMNLEKTLLAIVLMFLMMVFVVACSSNDNKGEGQNEKDTTSEETNGEADNNTDVAVDDSIDWEGQEIVVQMIGDFKEEATTDPITGEKVAGVNILKEEFERLHPGATVDFILMPWEGYIEKTQAMLNSNEADVYQMPGTAVHAPNGVLEPLQPFIDEDEDFDLSIFLDSQVDGWKAIGPDSPDNELEVYGLPFLGDARFIMYDKQLFDEWDVDYPSSFPTMEEIGEIAEKMTGTNPVTGEQNYGVWFRGDWETSYLLVNLAEGLNGQWGTGFAWEDVEFEFDSPEMNESLNWLLDMQEFAPQGLVSNQGNEMWLTEDNNIAIMLHQGPGDLKKVYEQGLEDRVDIVQEFKNDEGVGSFFAGSPLTIAKSSENKELAWEWLKFAASDFTQKYITEELGLTPVVKSAKDWDYVAEHDLMLKVFGAMETVALPKYPWGSAQPDSILTSEAEAALTGKRTVEEALDKAQKESTEWVENR